MRIAPPSPPGMNSTLHAALPDRVELHGVVDTKDQRGVAEGCCIEAGLYIYIKDIAPLLGYAFFFRLLLK